MTTTTIDRPVAIPAVAPVPTPPAIVKRALTTPDMFRTWLRQDPERVVGWAADPDSCPLATWLDTLLGDHTRASVGPDLIILVDSTGTEWDNLYPPEWAGHFVDQIDNRDDGAVRPVTGIVALHCLDEAMVQTLLNPPIP